MINTVKNLNTKSVAFTSSYLKQVLLNKNENKRPFVFSSMLLIKHLNVVVHNHTEYVGDNVVIQRRLQTIQEIKELTGIYKFKLTIYASAVSIMSWYHNVCANDKVKCSFLLVEPEELRTMYKDLSRFLGFHHSHYSFVDNNVYSRNRNNWNKYDFFNSYGNIITLYYTNHTSLNRKKKEIIWSVVYNHLSATEAGAVKRLLFSRDEQHKINKVFKHERSVIEKTCFNNFSVDENEC